MFRRLIPLVLAISTSWTLLAASPSTIAQEKSAPTLPEPQPAVEILRGEKIDPSLYGPAVIESMEEVIARDQLRPPGAVENPKDRNGQQGRWIVPKPDATFNPHSGVHNVMNKWGDTMMGISFPPPIGPVHLHGAFVNGQAGKGVWTPRLRVIAYRDGRQIAVTEWFQNIGEAPQWFEMNLVGVDRIQIEAVPVMNGGGWYAMDDLSFTPPLQWGGGEAGEPRRLVADFEPCKDGQDLTDSKYMGLIWEQGTGEFDLAVPGPVGRIDEPPTHGPDPEDGRGGTDATLPTLVASFQGVIRGDAGQASYPPDTCGAIGPNHFVEVVNRNFSVYDRTTGTRVVNASLGSFLPGGNGDPRVVYDQHSGRWIIIDSDFTTRIFLAVSTTNNPTGTFFKTSFVASTGSDTGCFPDYPTLGVDANGIYTAAYMVGCGMTIFAIDKAPLIAAAPSLGAVTAFRALPLEGAIQPAHTYGTPAGEFCVSRQSATALRLRRVNPPLTAPTLTTLTSVTIPSHSAPADAPALGSTTPLDTVDARPMNAVYRDNTLWTAHTISLSGRAACRWYKINATTSALLDSGTVSDAVRHYFFPGIAVNSVGDVVMGFSGSHASEYAGAYYTGRAAGDPAGQMAPPALLRAGVAAHNLIDSYGRNRWGDYSLTTLDPNDQLTLWTMQEYVHALNTWGTYIGRFTLTPEPINNACVDATLVGAGSVAFTTVGSTTDGPDEPGSCLFNGASNILNDIWFKYLAQCTGNATVSLCGSSFNSKIAAYGSSCPGASGQVIACNDNFCGNAAQITFPVINGTLYRIRIGSPSTATGTGTMVITCVATCPADITGDGQVNVNDLLAVVNAWGPCPTPPALCPADITIDGQVNINDLLAVINGWGPCP